MEAGAAGVWGGEIIQASDSFLPSFVPIMLEILLGYIAHCKSVANP